MAKPFLFQRHHLLASLIGIICPMLALAAMMQSSGYEIQSDSLNYGGVSFSTTSEYFLGDSLGEIATGESNSTDFIMGAGFWQMQESYISISSPSDISLSSINGVTGGAGTGQADWHVVTDNEAGYSLTIKANQSPALQSTSDSFADYTPAGDPDFAFSVNSGNSAFGFSPEGEDITATYKDNGSVCNTGSLDTADACWNGLSTSDQLISASSTSNQPKGATTTVKFRAESGSSHIQTSGTYTTSITVTAVTL